MDATGRPDTALITGPLVLGFIFGSILYGILCVQVLLYYTSFPKDERWIKIYVAILFGFETLFTIFSTIEAWNTLGTGWGDPHRLSYLDWSAGPLPSICGIVTSMVHAFYCWRIVKLTGSWVLPVVIGMVSLTQLAMTIGLTARFAMKGLSVGTLRATTTISAIWLLGAAFCDIIIATSMVIILLRARNRSTVKATNTVIHRLIKLVVETGVITSWGAIMDATLFLAFKNNNLHFLVFYSLAKLYSNTMLATLNARGIIKGKHDRQQDQDSVFWRDRDTRRSIELNDRAGPTHTIIIERQITFSPPLTPRLESKTRFADMEDGGEEGEKGGPISPASGTTLRDHRDDRDVDLERGGDIGDLGSTLSPRNARDLARMEQTAARVVDWTPSECTAQPPTRASAMPMIPETSESSYFPDRFTPDLEPPGRKPKEDV